MILQTELIYVVLVVILVSVALASLFVRHLVALIGTIAEMHSFHTVSYIDKRLFKALQEKGEVTTTANLQRKIRNLTLSTAACAMWWSAIIGYVAFVVITKG